MALKKPTDLFDKKEVSGVFETPEVSSHITESYDRFLNNFEKVNELSVKVEELSNQLSEKLTRSDLENAMLSQLMVLDENFKTLQSEVKGLNKKDLKEFKETVYNLSDIVENIVEIEIPKYKKKITKNELYFGEKVEQLQDIVEENLTGIREEIDTKFDNIAEVVDNNINYFNNQLQETSSQVKKTTDTYNKLVKIAENKLLKDNEKLEDYSRTIESLLESFKELKTTLSEDNFSYQEKIQNIISERVYSISSTVDEKIDTLTSTVENEVQSVNERVSHIQDEVNSEISNLKADVVIFEKHNKDTEKTIQEFSSKLSDVSKLDESIQKVEEDVQKVEKGVEELKSQYEDVSNQYTETKKNLESVERYTQSVKEQVFDEIKKLPINDIQEDFKIISKEFKDSKNHIEVVQQYIQNHHQDIEILKEEVFTEIDNLPFGNLQENIQRLEKKIDYIKETYSQIQPEVIVKEVIKEGLLNEPPETKNSDPLTPLNQNFVTLDKLQEHYRLFLNRIQQQLSTIGGGGETQLKYLDDIVGIATNASAYDGKYLKYNHSTGKFEFSDVDSTNDSWIQGVNGPYTYGNVGIGITNSTQALDVVGNINASGTVTANSDIKLKDNIKTIPDALSKVLSLRGVEYDKIDNGDHQIGVIAQEVEEIVPEVVYGDEIKSVAYANLVGLLIEAIKEQNQRIDELEKRLGEL